MVQPFNLSELLGCKRRPEKLQHPLKYLPIDYYRFGQIVADRTTRFPMRIVGITKDTLTCDFEGNEGDVFEINIKDAMPVLRTFESREMFSDKIDWDLAPFDNTYITDDGWSYPSLIGCGLAINALDYQKGADNAQA